MLDRIARLKLHSRFIILGFVLSGFCCSIIMVFPGIVPAADSSPPTVGNVNATLLEGRWIRSDGGYVLELRNIGDDGTLTAAYFNPQPIRVFQAFWTTDKETIALFVELRDVNYPGSKYSLRYDKATDRLHGSYFQAVEQQRYEVEFVRYR
jgi:hypothetical protein